jgi:hypothetical protein
MRRVRWQIPLLLFATMLATAASHAQTPSPPTPQAQGAPTLAPTPQGSQPAVASPAPLTVRVEAIPTVELKSPPSDLSLKDFAPSVGALIGLIGAVMAVLISGMIAQRNNQASIEAAQKNNQTGIDAAQRNAEASIMAAQRNNEAGLWQKANETELKEIQAKLDGFYGPFLQLSGMNSLLARELRDRQPDKDKYRLLRSLFDKQWLESLSDGDKTIVREICNNAALLEAFIKDKAAMVDAKILPYLFRASAHFRMLHLAYNGELGTNPTNFLRYVYPEQLDKVLELEVERLQRRSDLLRAHPGDSPGPLEPLNIPAKREFELPEWPSPVRGPIPA